MASIGPGRSGRFLQVNGAMCRLTGDPEHELVGKHWSDITHPDDLARSAR